MPSHAIGEERFALQNKEGCCRFAGYSTKSISTLSRLYFKHSRNYNEQIPLVCEIAGRGQFAPRINKICHLPETLTTIITKYARTGQPFTVQARGVDMLYTLILPSYLKAHFPCRMLENTPDL